MKSSKTLSFDTYQTPDGTWDMKVQLEGYPRTYIAHGYTTEEEAFADIPTITDIFCESLNLSTTCN